MGFESATTLELGAPVVQVDSAPDSDGPATSESHETLFDSVFAERYQILSQIGRGGMGAVFRARDRDLGRDVALKVVRAGREHDGKGAARLRREARALARLNHPNIVSVYDVFERRGTVYIAMEFIRGRTAASWLQHERPGWREALAVMLEAGRGLSAAHDAGIVHRDFKPGNVMLADEGRSGASRVRVLDFGLARQWPEEVPSEPADSIPSTQSIPSFEVDPLSLELTRPGFVLGTPRYMAPEQHCGHPVEAVADQYALCLSIWEALTGTFPFSKREYADLVTAKLRKGHRRPKNTPVPDWVWSAVERGLEPDPTRRWPDVDTLLHALSGEAHRRRRVWYLGAGGVIAAGALGGLLASPEPNCSEGARWGADGWGEHRRTLVSERIHETELPFAADTAQRVVDRLDEYAERWVNTWQRGCASSSIDADPMFDRRVACMRLARREFDHTVDALSSELDDGDVRNAVRMVDALPPPADCEDANRLRMAAPTPASREQAQADEALRLEASHATVLRREGKYREARRLLSDIVVRAEVSGSPMLLADLRYQQGRNFEVLGRPDDAIVEYERAYVTASRVGHDHQAFASAIQLVHVYGARKRDFAAAERWQRHAQAELDRGMEDPRTQANYEQHVAVLAQLQRRFDEALERHRRALELYRRAYGADHMHVASTLNNLGILYWERGESELAAAYYREALDIKQKNLGPNHPALASSLNNTAIALHDSGKLEDAVAMHRRTLALKEQTLGPHHLSVSNTLSNMANSLVSLGRYDEARPLYERALEIIESIEPNGERTISPLQGLGRVMLEQGRPEEARAVLERSIGVAERLEKPLDAAQSRFELARTLVVLGEDRDYAVSMAVQARENHVDAGGRQAQKLARIDAWLQRMGAATPRER